MAAGAVPSWLHHVLALATLVVHGYATLAGGRTIRENMAVMDELDRVIAGLAEDGRVDVTRATV